MKIWTDELASKYAAQTIDQLLGPNKVGPLRQFFSRVAYELHFRDTYYQPQTVAKIVGTVDRRSPVAVPAADYAPIAPVMLGKKRVIAVLHKLPADADSGERLRVGIFGKMDAASAELYVRSTGLRPTLRLEVVASPAPRGAGWISPPPLRFRDGSKPIPF
jgi:hypothetical protein